MGETRVTLSRDDTRTARKIKLSLYLTYHHTMKAYGGVDVYIRVFLTSTLVEGSSELHGPAMGKSRVG
jgi:hypothetical protein